MSRAAILPYPGDPFLLTYWLHLFDKVWGQYVDKLYIYLNSPVEATIIDYIKDLCAKHPKINLQYENHQIEHGEAINRTLDIVQEDLIMLVEDDGFIFKPGIVQTCFNYIESGHYDIVGGKRGSCGFELLEQAKKRWGLNYEGLGDQGPNFWPCFFFCRKELLLKTDRNFGSRLWKAGEYCEPLEFTVTSDQCGDTFVNTSLQLRNLIPKERIICIPQYHGSPDDIEHYYNHQFLFDGISQWCHVGSLSSGIGGLLRDNEGRPLSRRLIDPPGDTQLPPICNTEQERREFERRVQWWMRFYQFYRVQVGTLTILDFAMLYLSAIENIIKQYNLSRHRITNRLMAYASLGL